GRAAAVASPARAEARRCRVSLPLLLLLVFAVLGGSVGVIGNSPLESHCTVVGHAWAVALSFGRSGLSALSGCGSGVVPRRSPSSGPVACRRQTKRPAPSVS